MGRRAKSHHKGVYTHAGLGGTGGPLRNHHNSALTHRHRQGRSLPSSRPKSGPCSAADQGEVGAVGSCQCGLAPVTDDSSAGEAAELRNPPRGSRASTLHFHIYIDLTLFLLLTHLLCSEGFSVSALVGPTRLPMSAQIRPELL